MMIQGAAMAYRRTNQASQPKPQAKPQRDPLRASGMPRTETGGVDSPTVAGATERVLRVIDTLHAMMRRKQITQREYFAGERYRTSHETIHGSVGGSMDFERARGGSLPGSPPAPSYMLASEACREAKFRLYPKDYAVVHRVCGLGMTVEEAAAGLYGVEADGRPSRPARDDCGRRLKEGLAQLADLWFPQEAGSGAKVRGFRTDSHVAGEAGEVPKASAVHATGDRVYRTGGR